MARIIVYWLLLCAVVGGVGVVALGGAGYILDGVAGGLLFGLVLVCVWWYAFCFRG